MSGIVVVGSYGAGLTVTLPRAPRAGETVVGTDFAVAHGGKGSNQAVAAARLGARAVLCTVVGDDRHGAAARELWRAEGVDASLTQTVLGTTMVGVILVDEQGENRIAIVPGVLDRFAPDALGGLTSKFEGTEVLLVGLEIPAATACAALRIGRQAGLTTNLNPAPAPTSPLPRQLLAAVDHLTPNRTEAATLTGLPPDADPLDLVRHPVFEAVPTVALTLGGDGVLLRSGGRLEHIPSPAVDVVDTTGAGDAFNGAYAVGLSRGDTPEDAARFAVQAAAFAVTRALVVPSLPHRDDLISTTGG
jgi:ribokinase